MQNKSDFWLCLLTSLFIFVLSACGKSATSQLGEENYTTSSPYYFERIIVPDNILAVSSISKADDQSIVFLAETSNGTTVMQWNMDSEQSLTIIPPIEHSLKLVSIAAVPGREAFWCVSEEEMGSVFLQYFNQSEQSGDPIPLYTEEYAYNIENAICDKFGNV